jgi:hypothetical protein
MSIPNDDPEYLFNLLPDSELQKASRFDLGECSITEAFDAMRKVESWEELESVMIASGTKEGAHDVLRSIFLDFLKSIRQFQMENCTSMSNFCTTRASRSFAVSPATLSDDLDCTRVIKALSGPPYDEGVAAYLQKKGRGLEQETGCMPLRLPTFRVSDFFGHKSKLHLLGKLMDAGLNNINWNKFFESRTVEDYKTYVQEQLFQEILRKKHPAMVSSSISSPFAGMTAIPHPATRTTATSLLATSSNPLGAVLTETVQPDSQDDRIDEDELIDPFSPRDNNWGDGVAVGFYEDLDLSPVFTGTLTKNPIYEDTMPFSMVKKNNAEEA